MKYIACLALAFALLFTSCSGAPKNTSPTSASAPQPATEIIPLPQREPHNGTRTAVESAELQFQPPWVGATICEMATSHGTIHIILYTKQAPIATKNFITLAQQGYYNGSLFHRVVSNFMVQGGAAVGDGEDASIWGHPFRSEYTEYLRHYNGALCMAAVEGAQDSLLSQFYIVAAPQAGVDAAAAEVLRGAGLREGIVDAYTKAGGLPYLDNTDTVFGQVYAGMEVVDAIAAVEVDDEGRPLEDVRIESIAFTNYMPEPEPPVVEPPAEEPPAEVTDPVPEEGAPPASVPAEGTPEAPVEGTPEAPAENPPAA